MGVGVSPTARPPLPQGKTWYLLYRRLGGPQGRSGQARKISPPPGFDPRTVQPVASRYTDYATWLTRNNNDNILKCEVSIHNETLSVKSSNSKLNLILLCSFSFAVSVLCCTLQLAAEMFDINYMDPLFRFTVFFFFFRIPMCARTGLTVLRS